MRKDSEMLPRIAFSILLALSLKERHGYEIIQQIEEDSNGKIKLGPGALYTSIKKLYKKGLITEVMHPDDTRRRYYKLTGVGKTVLESELDYYQTAVALAHQRQLLRSTPNHA